MLEAVADFSHLANLGYCRYNSVAPKARAKSPGTRRRHQYDAPEWVSRCRLLEQKEGA